MNKEKMRQEQLPVSGLITKRRFGAGLGRGWAIYQAWATRLEALFSLLSGASALLFLSFFLSVMATSSLWFDEIYSVQFFSSRGPLAALTDYRAPNNHIFFNLLNSLTPKTNVYDPLQARLWSYVFFLALLGLLVAMCLPGKRFLIAAGLLQLIAVNNGLVDLALQARGYGFCCFCGGATALALWQFLQKREVRWLVVIGLLTLVGTWTLPHYVFFGGPLLLLLLVQVRTRPVFFVGLATALAVGLVYLPVAGQLLDQFGNYQEKFGDEYGSPHAVAQTLQEYLFNPSVVGLVIPEVLLWAFLIGLVVIAAASFRWPFVHAVAFRLLVAASLIFLGICLKLGTPPLRTTSFVVLPLAVCAAWLVGDLLYRPKLELVRPILAALIAFYLVRYNLLAAQRFHYIPIEDWSGLARYIEQTFPDGMTVSTITPNILQAYLPSAFPVIRTPASPSLDAGKTVVLDTPFDYRDQLVPGELSPVAATAILPRRNLALQLIIAAPLSQSNVASVEVDGKKLDDSLVDKNVETGWTQSQPSGPVRVRAYLPPGQSYRSLYWLARGAGQLPLNFKVTLTLTDGSTRPLDPAKIDTFKDVLVLHLGDQPVNFIEWEIGATPPGMRLGVSEIWAYPTALKN